MKYFKVQLETDYNHGINKRTPVYELVKADKIKLRFGREMATATILFYKKESFWKRKQLIKVINAGDWQQVEEVTKVEAFQTGLDNA